MEVNALAMKRRDRLAILLHQIHGREQAITTSAAPMKAVRPRSTHGSFRRLGAQGSIWSLCSGSAHFSRRNLKTLSAMAAE